MRSLRGSCGIALLCCLSLARLSLAAAGERTAPLAPSFRVSRDLGHPWRPPFGLERIGRPVTILVEASSQPAAGNYVLVASLAGKEAARYTLKFAEKAPYTARVTLDRAADELALWTGPAPPEKPVELSRHALRIPDFEAEAIARADNPINPVDLGTVLVPSGWLLLGPGQTATLEVAAISRFRDRPGAAVSARFESSPSSVATGRLGLRAGTRAQLAVKLPAQPAGKDRDMLDVAIDDGEGHELWRKRIPVMLVREPPRKPRFGATYEKLRFDAPISVRDPATGKYSDLDYERGWDRALRDIVVWLPNGARFVFWRGSSYIPFWAGLSNTGLCYEWAEIISQPKGAVDCVEPLMDKELRYSRVEIIQSTRAMVHVRWSYQSTDFNYKTWGDQAVEDYYFYPDGFGTRVVTLKADPANNYELSEFIILTPAGAYPFDVLAENVVDALFLDGRTHEFRLPNTTSTDKAAQEAEKTGVPAIYRLRLSKHEQLSAIYFNPGETHLPPVVFQPFFEAGEMVTPCYWGSHWPLARGNSTGNKIDDRIAFTPCHNSVMSWAGTKPEPVESTTLDSLDALGRSRRMVFRRWAWLIGMTEESDAQLRDRARSFGKAPDLELAGARPDLAGYQLERGAICLEALARDVRISAKPSTPWVNPVFEFSRAARGGIRVKVAGQTLAAEHFAWDGVTLWLGKTIGSPTTIEITFGPSAKNQP